MKFCPNCGAPIEEGHKFCANCGEKLPVSDMPAEPVYTDDPALLSNPVLNQSPNFDTPAAKTEKIPELTLEPDLWGLPAAAKPAEPAAPAAAAASAAAVAQAPSYASVMEDIPYDNDLRREQEERRRHKEEELRRLEEARRKREEQRAAEPAPDNVPDDYTMSRPLPEEEPVPQLQDETLMLVWSIILTALCSIPGLVGLIKTIKARKAPTLALKARLLSSAKIWLIIGTVFRAMVFLGNLFG